MTKAKLLEQESVITKLVCGFLRTRERRDRVSLGIVAIRPYYNLVQARGWDARTVVPMMRIGFLSSLGLNGGSCSTERTGHLYNV